MSYYQTWVGNYSTTPVHGLRLVLQFIFILVNRAELQYQKQPVDRGGTVFAKKKKKKAVMFLVILHKPFKVVL